MSEVGILVNSTASKSGMRVSGQQQNLETKFRYIYRKLVVFYRAPAIDWTDSTASPKLPHVRKSFKGPALTQSPWRVVMVFGDFSTEGCFERQILEALPLGLILKSTISRKCLGVLLLRHTDL